MNKIETKSILDTIAAIDNRKVTPEVIEAWYEILKNLPYDNAKEALRLAQQDASIRYLEPRHIISWGKEVAFRTNRAMPVDLLLTESSPPPVCKHGMALPKCLPCCRELNA